MSRTMTSILSRPPVVHFRLPLPEHNIADVSYFPDVPDEEGIPMYECRALCACGERSYGIGYSCEEAKDRAFSHHREHCGMVARNMAEAA